MFSIFKNDSSNGSSGATNNIILPRTVSRHNWAEIYGREGTSARNNVVQTENVAPVATVNMQSARSTGNLDQLGRGIDGMSINARTATSTPTGRHGSPDGIDIIETSMPGAFHDPRVPQRTINAVSRQASPYRSQDLPVERSMIPDTRGDDDVFGCTNITDVHHFSNSQATSALADPVAGVVVHDATPIPRADRLAQPITPQNAQGLLTPDSCLFVANLSTNLTDDELAAIVQGAFQRYGYNVVKVRRDKHQYPFALVQFDNTENARRALQGSQNMIVGGRRIRTEAAQARRSVIMYKRDGSNVSNQEVFQVLRGYGHIEDVKPTTNADAQIGIPNGCWVKFSFYLDYKDCLNNFNPFNGIFFIMDGPSLEAPQRDPLVGGFGYGFQGPNTPRSPTDTRSVFVGNLPFNVTEPELVNTFQAYGVVRLCNIIRKPIAGQSCNTFAFIEFSNIHEAYAAARAEVDLRGKRIRVEPKEYSTRRYARSYGQNSMGQGYRARPYGPQGYGQAPQHSLPYGFQPIMGNYGPDSVAPYHGGSSWHTSPPSAYLPYRFPPDGQHYNGSPAPARNMPDHYGPSTPTHGQYRSNVPLGTSRGPMGPIPPVGQSSSVSPLRGPEAGANDFGPPQQ